jgi:subfamily B ATP-binding cassette protein MsbA
MSYQKVFILTLESGNKLSGGQNKGFRSLVLFENPPIMILDEATSALDTESEKFVQVALENMMQKERPS